MYRVKYSIMCMSLLMLTSLHGMHGHVRNHKKNKYQLKSAQYLYEPEGSRTSKKRELAQHIRYEKNLFKQQQKQQKQAQENASVATLLALRSIAMIPKK